MKRASRTKRKSNKFKYYILLSILIHLAVFSFSYSKKNITLGENIIPIEIMDIPSIASQGEYFQQTPKKKSKEVREGDWKCPMCGANVFASKNECFKCGASRVW